MKSAPPPPNELERLASLRSLRLLDSLPERQYDDLVHLASTICSTPIALISLVDEGRQWFKAKVGLAARQTPRQVAFCAHAILEPERVFVVRDAFSDERFRDNPLVTRDPNVRFYAGAPLRSPDGLALGTLCVLDRVPRDLTPEQLTSLEALSRQVTNLLALRQQTVELEDANRRLSEREVELEKTTRELNENVARFRSTFEQNAIGLTIVGLDGRYLSVNRAFTEMLGYTEAEIIGVNALDITHPDDRAATEERIANVHIDNVNVAKRFIRKDGEVLWTENVARRITDDKGQPLYWLSQIQNVSARKESEERLAAQYAMARVLAEASTLEDAAPRMLATLCASGNWDIAAIWEIDESDTVLQTAAVASAVPEPPERIEAVRKLTSLRGEGVAGRVWASGSSMWVEDALSWGDPGLTAKANNIGMRSVLAVPVKVEGAVIGVVSLFGRETRAPDEAARTRAEALSAQIGSFLTRKRAETMQRRMVTVLENTSDFVVITDRHATPLYLNQAGRAMLEIPLGVDARQLKWEDYIPLWAAVLMRGELTDVARDAGRWTGTFAYRTASGREIPVSQVTIAPKGADGVTLFYASVARDITEAKKVERMKNEFVSTVSHELRTPLTSIRGALGLLEGGVLRQLDEPTLEVVRIARTNSDRLIRLVNDMLDLEKIEAGKLEMMLCEADAEMLVASAVGSVRGMAEQAGVTLQVELEPELHAFVDIDRTVQVITNLLSNAVKFSPAGATVTLRASSRYGRARFEVADEGPGIAPELRARLFQKFQQLDASDTRAKGGTGLGLSISKAIIEQLGGTIGVDSTPGEGSTFWFEVTSAQAVRRSIAPNANGAKVLVVDDDPSIRAILSRLLETLGVRVLHAADGALAIHLARTESPDLIVLDLGMPRPDGFEVVTILQDEVARSTPLLVYTARDLSQADREALTLGDTRYLTKSRASESSLLATVRELLGRPGILSMNPPASR